MNSVNTKRSPWIRTAALALGLCLVVSTGICGTLAKYTSGASGNDVVSVAQWKIEVADVTNGSAAVDITGNDTVSFDLFNTIKDTGNVDAETDVKAGMIAPGTAGAFQMTVANKSEVNATYNIVFTEADTTDGAKLPVLYRLKLNSGEYTAWGEIASLNQTANAIAMESGVDTILVEWMWAFEQTDVAAGDLVDTGIGVGAQTTANELTVTAAITVVQVD